MQELRDVSEQIEHNQSLNLDSSGHLKKPGKDESFKKNYVIHEVEAEFSGEEVNLSTRAKPVGAGYGQFRPSEMMNINQNSERI